MSKKIMHLLTGTSFSGAENVACQIMACFKNDAEYEMFYCSPDGKIREALKERNVRFAPMKEWSLSEVKRMENYYGQALSMFVYFLMVLSAQFDEQREKKQHEY